MLPKLRSAQERTGRQRIATFISGYPGSPLAGYDLALSRIPDLLAEHDVTYQIRGYEQVKHEAAERANARAADLTDQLRRPRLPISTT
ncbi:pyruvate ferredoxin/flavodoxin oxidoreductase [Mycobacterium tuberculosis]|nr:pyruvate ferredoxin/flavodoxin oxidoreductase [Mycobacterium tuberculosis]